MFFNLAAIAAFTLSVSAAPFSNGEHHGQDAWYLTDKSSYESGQQPFKFPLANGFPNVQVPSSALTQIQKQAHGTLPNSPLPTSLTSESATVFQAIAFGELFEVAYFTSLLNNVTQNVPGYEIGSSAVRTLVINALTAVQAQEELHAIGVNAILSSAGKTPVQPCEYIFPVDTFDSAIEVAAAFTDAVVLGGLQDALNVFATDGDEEVVPLLTSVVGQEGEQNGFYRSLLGLIPSALPFLTRSTGPFGFSFINQHFIVPGSCQTKINVPIFKPLTIESECVEPKDQSIKFSFNGNATASTSNLHLVYINQQNLPVVESLQNIRKSGDEISFSAYFPYTKYEMNGLTIAVVTKSAGPFTSADAVANATVYGPAVIEIN